MTRFIRRAIQTRNRLLHAVLIIATIGFATMGHFGCANTSQNISDESIEQGSATMPVTRLSGNSLTQTAGNSTNVTWAAANGLMATDQTSTLTVGIAVWGQPLELGVDAEGRVIPAPPDGAPSTSAFGKFAQDAAATGVKLEYKDDDDDGIPNYFVFECDTYEGNGSDFLEHITAQAAVWVELLKQQSADQREVTIQLIEKAVPELGAIIRQALTGI